MEPQILRFEELFRGPNPHFQKALKAGFMDIPMAYNSGNTLEVLSKIFFYLVLIEMKMSRFLRCGKFYVLFEYQALEGKRFSFKGRLFYWCGAGLSKFATPWLWILC